MSTTESTGGRRLLGQILKSQGAVRESQVQEALEGQRNQGGLIGQHLVAIGACDGAAVAAALAEQAGLESVDLATAQPTEEALALIDELRPRRTVLTNMHTDLDYATLSAELPDGIEVGYDGLEIVLS